jgi:predicted Fe-Mo cluster-binding NifX family protein
LNLCIPVLEDRGLESPVSAHFGSAPLFLFVDTETGACRAVSNGNLHHNHGMCQPLQSLAGEKVEAIVVGGIGMGALRRLLEANIQVYRSEFASAKATVAAFEAGTLHPVTPQTACGHHGHGEHGGPRPNGGCHGQQRTTYDSGSGK